MSFKLEPISYRIIRHFNQSKLKQIDSLGEGSIDKINILTNHYNQDFLKNNCITHHRISGKRYRFGAAFVFEFSTINVFLLPTFTSQYNCKIEVNPSHFEGYADFLDFMSCTLDGADDYRVKRIDCAVILPSEQFPVDLFFHSIRVRGKRKVARFRETRLNYKTGVCSGFSIGRSPHRVTAYDRDLERWRNKEEYEKAKSEGKLLKQTKFEIQVSTNNHEPKILTLEDLYNKPLANPFEKVSFFNLYTEIPLRRSESKDRLEDFRTLAFAHSYHNARSLMNRDKNVLRLEKHFPALLIGRHQTPLDHFLWQSYKKSVSQWLKT